MAQLIVRKLEDVVVTRLREEAARYGVSMEEAHRRILREALVGSPEVGSLKEHLLAIPKAGDDEPDDLFDRQQDEPREAEL